MKKFVFALTFAIIIIMSMNFRCSKGYILPPPNDYEFIADVDIYPLKKTYSLSDTIWIETDLPSKDLFDNITGQNINADTCNIPFGATYNEFGMSVTNPSNGFCKIISSDAYVAVDRAPWSTGALIHYGCGQPSFKCRVGFKPLYPGAYYLALSSFGRLERCPSKVKPINAIIAYTYKNVDLNLDVYNSLPASIKGDSNSVASFTDQINNREIFVFTVQ